MKLSKYSRSNAKHKSATARSILRNSGEKAMKKRFRGKSRPHFVVHQLITKCLLCSELILFFLSFQDHGKLREVEIED